MLACWRRHPFLVVSIFLVGLTCWLGGLAVQKRKDAIAGLELDFELRDSISNQPQIRQRPATGNRAGARMEPVRCPPLPPIFESSPARLAVTLCWHRFLGHVPTGFECRYSTALYCTSDLTTSICLYHFTGCQAANIVLPRCNIKVGVQASGITEAAMSIPFRKRALA